MVTDRLGLINEFTHRYRSRIVSGLATYGEFDADKDTRLLAREAIEECLDIGSYLEFLEQKYPRLRPRVQKIRANTILLYGALKVLEAEESTLTRWGDL